MAATRLGNRHEVVDILFPKLFGLDNIICKSKSEAGKLLLTFEYLDGKPLHKSWYDTMCWELNSFTPTTIERTLPNNLSLSVNHNLESFIDLMREAKEPQALIKKLKKSQIKKTEAKARRTGKTPLAEYNMHAQNNPDIRTLHRQGYYPFSPSITFKK